MSINQLHTEKELFIRIAEGDEAAFNELFTLTSPVIYSIAQKLTGDHSAVPDIIQEIFLRIWINRDKLPDIENPRSWLLQITYHYIFDVLRRNKTKEKAYASYPQPLSDLPDDIQFNETRQLILKAIETLPDQAKLVYRLNREKGLSINEIAEQLQLAPQTVKNTLGRAIKAIRSYLERHGILLPLLWLILLI